MLPQGQFSCTRSPKKRRPPVEPLAGFIIELIEINCCVLKQLLTILLGCWNQQTLVCGIKDEKIESCLKKQFWNLTSSGCIVNIMKLHKVEPNTHTLLIQSMFMIAVNCLTIFLANRKAFFDMGKKENSCLTSLLLFFKRPRSTSF